MKPSIHIGNIVYELTEACNQCCRFCYNYWRDGSTPLPPPAPRLVRKTLRKLLSQASVSTISFSGGEPMLLRNIHDLAMLARFKGSNVNVLTNGGLLTDDAVTNFKNIGVGAVQIPLLSADPAIHDFLTQVPGSWEKAVAATRRAVAAFGKGVYTVLVITKVNAPGVPETLRLLGDLGLLLGDEGLGVVAGLDKAHHLAEVHVFISNDLVVLVKRKVGDIAFGEFQISGAL